MRAPRFSAAHKDATIFGYFDGALFAGPIQGLFDLVDHDGPATGLQARIASTDVIGTVATVRVEEDNWTGHRFTTLFTVLKVDGEWKIMNKVFHQHQHIGAESETSELLSKGARK